MEILFKSDKKSKKDPSFFQKTRKTKFFSLFKNKFRKFLVLFLMAAVIGLSLVAFLLFQKSKNRTQQAVKLEEAISYLEKGNKVKGVSILEGLHKDNPQDKKISYYLALGYFGVNDFDKFLDLAQKENLESAPILNLKAQFFRMQGDFKKAVEYYEKAIAAYPKSINTYINLASLYQSRGDFSKAIKILEKGLELAPRSASLNATIASVFLKMGDKEKALHYAQTALKYDKDNRQAKAILANL